MGSGKEIAPELPATGSILIFFLKIMEMNASLTPASQ